MSYIGNQPAESYASFEKQVFTIVNSQTAYTLTNAVTNENDIRLVVNNVVQEPGSGKAYTASSTTLTLSAALVNGTDEMYCVYLGRALQTVNPPNASVGSSQTAPTIITGQTAETSIATDDTILIHDTSASALRKMTRANFVSGIGGTNTPAFRAFANANFTVANTTFEKIPFNAESFDTASAFNTSTNAFTVPSGQAGKYFISVGCRKNNARADRFLLDLRVNDTGVLDSETGSYGNYGVSIGNIIISLSVGDVVNAYVYHNLGSNLTFRGTSDGKDTFLQGYKIIE